MDAAMKYEGFIRAAFELALEKRIGRLEDPAGFADTDTFTNGNLPVVKAATGYAVGIYRNYIKKKPETMNDTCANYLCRIISAAHVAEIAKIIQEFNAEVVEQCFDRVDGALQPK